MAVFRFDAIFSQAFSNIPVEAETEGEAQEKLERMFDGDIKVTVSGLPEESVANGDNGAEVW